MLLHKLRHPSAKDFQALLLRLHQNPTASRHTHCCSFPRLRRHLCSPGKGAVFYKWCLYVFITHLINEVLIPSCSLQRPDPIAGICELQDPTARQRHERQEWLLHQPSTTGTNRAWCSC